MNTLVGLVLLTLMTLTAEAAPVIPADDRQVLQVLPSRTMAGTERRALDAATRAWRAEPRSVDRISTLARLYINQTRSSSDPRYLGYALALLAPWANKAEVPLSIRLLRATIAQFNHQFQPALAEIATIVRLDPAQTEARLMRASILMVQGDYAGARADCARLLEPATLMLGLVCRAQVAGLTGRAVEADQTLARLLTLDQAGVGAEIREWMLMTRIDINQRLGRTAVAGSLLNQLLAAGELSSSGRAAHADWLLSQRQYKEMIAFADGDTRDDGLLLRLALAENALRQPEAAAHIRLLLDRFTGARLRGDRIHLREEARFTLDLLQQPMAALKLAQDNWQVQREPADARLLLDAARAARQPAAAAPVLDWLRTSGIEDLTLRRDAAALSGGRS